MKRVNGNRISTDKKAVTVSKKFTPVKQSLNASASTIKRASTVLVRKKSTGQAN